MYRFNLGRTDLGTLYYSVYYWGVYATQEKGRGVKNESQRSQCKQSERKVSFYELNTSLR